MAEEEDGKFKYISEMDVRMMLRDYDPAANTLLDDWEFDSEEIRTAATFAVDYWNEVPPDIGYYTLYDFPWRYHLVKGTCSNLLSMAAHRYRRNRLDYQVPGGGISDQNKAAEYDQIAMKLWQEYKTWVARKKMEVNAGRGWGSV